jgi:FkbM family methyltransferase
VRSFQQIKSGIERRLFERRLPFVVTLRDFDPSGVKYEVSSLAERFRVIEHGGETEYTSAMLEYLRPGDVLFDVGANVGMVALHAAGICRVVAFEPDPAIRRRLQVNSALNPTRSFSIEDIAIGDMDGSAILYTNGDRGTSPSLVRQRDEAGSVRVSARTLDSLASEGRLPQPTVVKLDIEGAEVLALRGARRLLSGPDKPRALFIEVHDTFLPGFGSSADEVGALLHDFGYTKEVYRTKRGDQTHLILAG